MKRIYSLPAIGLLFSLLLGHYVSQAQSTFTVDVKGKGKPMILIHGLFCDKNVWDETVAHYQDRYECHILTLAGFGGNAPVSKDYFMGAVKDDIIAYVKEKKLKKPVLMGHSMGAFLSFFAASSAPGMFEKVVAVDGLPFLTTVQMPGATAESAKPMATNMRNMMSRQTPEQIQSSQKMILPNLMNSPQHVEKVTAIAVKADAPTQGQVLYEMFTTDLRDAVANIDCPVLLLGAWAGFKNYGATRESVEKTYTEQVSKIKTARVEISDNAKHFIFYDDPQWFFEKVDTFLK